jgi:2-dehydro-3-deoxyglucarate aldolase
MHHRFRKRLKSGELLIGTVVTLASPEVVEILTEVGFDWLFIDAEHAPLEALEMQRLLQGASTQMPCVVRVAASEEVPIKKALDIGAAGVIAPMVNSAEQARRVVHLAKYAPAGTRGVGLGRAQGYGLRFGEYVGQANEDTAVIIQAEHAEAVKHIETIVEVAGVDAVLVGPYDLSASLGRLGKVGHPEVVAAIEHVTEVCQEAGMPLGIFGVSHEAVNAYIERGYTLIAAGVDTMMLGKAATEMLSQIKSDSKNE